MLFVQSTARWGLLATDCSATSPLLFLILYLFYPFLTSIGKRPLQAITEDQTPKSSLSCILGGTNVAFRLLIFQSWYMSCQTVWPRPPCSWSLPKRRRILRERQRLVQAWLVKQHEKQGQLNFIAASCGRSKPSSLISCLEQACAVDWETRFATQGSPAVLFQGEVCSPRLLALRDRSANKQAWLRAVRVLV